MSGPRETWPLSRSMHLQVAGFFDPASSTASGLVLDRHTRQCTRVEANGTRDTRMPLNAV